MQHVELDEESADVETVPTDADPRASSLVAGRRSWRRRPGGRRVPAPRGRPRAGRWSRGWPTSPGCWRPIDDAAAGRVALGLDGCASADCSVSRRPRLARRPGRRRRRLAARSSRTTSRPARCAGRPSCTGRTRRGRRPRRTWVRPRRSASRRPTARDPARDRVPGQRRLRPVRLRQHHAGARLGVLRPRDRHRGRADRRPVAARPAPRSRSSTTSPSSPPTPTPTARSTLDGRDLRTGEPRWTDHEPAPAATGSDDGITDWPPDVYRVATPGGLRGRRTDARSCSTSTVGACTASTDRRCARTGLRGSSSDGTPRAAGSCSASGPTARATPAPRSWTATGRGTRSAAARTLPMVDDGSVPGLLLFFAAEPGRDAAPASSCTAPTSRPARRGGAPTLKVSTDIPRGDDPAGPRVRADPRRPGRGRRAQRADALVGRRARRHDGRSADDRWSSAARQRPGPDDSGPGDLVALDPATGAAGLAQAPCPTGVDHVYPVGDVLLGLGRERRRARCRRSSGSAEPGLSGAPCARRPRTVPVPAGPAPAARARVG